MAKSRGSQPRLNGLQAHRHHQIGHSDHVHIGRRCFGIPSVVVADLVFERPPRQLGIDLNLAAEIVIWIDAAEHDLGVGIGRFGAARAVAGGARHCAHALRADIENPALIDPADRAAAGADINRIH